MVCGGTLLDMGIGRGYRHKPKGERPRVYEELMVLVPISPKLGQIFTVTFGRVTPRIKNRKMRIYQVMNRGRSGVAKRDPTEGA